MLRSLFIAVILLLSACRETPNPPLRIAINPWPGYEFLYLAERLKLFEAEGVEVRILQFSSLNDSRRAFELGKADGFGGTLIETLIAAQNSQRRPQVVYLPDYSNGGDLIIARRGIDSLEALAGKRVAIEPGTLNGYILARALAHRGVNLQAVRQVGMPQPEMHRALTHGEIDAAVTYAPFSVDMLKNPQLQPLFTTREIPGEVLDVLAIDASVVQQRREQVDGLLRAFNRALLYSRAHPQEAYAIMAAREGISAEDFRNAAEHDLKMLDSADQAAFHGHDQRLFKALQATQQVLLDSGELRQPQPLATLIAPQP